MVRFGQRLSQAIATHGPLCVGIDPHPHLLEGWGLPDTVAGLRDFARIAIEGLDGHVAAVKPQTAFFERLGSSGLEVLEEVVEMCQKRSLLCIVDAKRGDIGSTMAGYADAFLKEGAPFAGDAVTLSPFLGPDSLGETVEFAQTNNRGVFLLALTSNPEGSTVQHAKTRTGSPVAKDVVSFAARFNEGLYPLGDVGIVVGVTMGEKARQLGIDLTQLHGPILAPGLGAQGGKVQDLPTVFGSALNQVIVNSSREILAWGPDPDQVARAARELSTRLGSLTHDP